MVEGTTLAGKPRKARATSPRGSNSDVKDQRQLAIAFVDSVGATYPSLFDPRGEVALAFRGFPANVVPSTILLDRLGRVAAVYTGQVSGDDLRTAVALVLEEGPA